MANEEQLNILRQGVKVWNKWREENLHTTIDFFQADLRGADLVGVNLNRVDLNESNLSSADLVGAHLVGASLKGAYLIRTDLSAGHLFQASLREADLSHAVLITTDFSEADLSGANLSNADFVGANLSHAKLSGSNFSNAKLGNTVLAFTNIYDVLNIEAIEHSYSSSLGIEIIHNSKGYMPEVFLRGCGLSDLEIETAKLSASGLDPEQVTDITYKIHQLYLGGGIQYYSCFISYNSRDEEFARKLHDDLQNNGVRCWFAPEDLKIGDQIRPTIDRQIRLRDKLLVILSENSVKSEWVGDEVEGAIEEESKSNRLVLFPLRLDDTVFNTRDDWAAKIKRRRHIGDFSNWKDKGSYQKAFESLLRDLKATGGGVNGE